MQLSINIDVPDLDQGIRFYQDGLGLQCARVLFGGAVAELRGGPVPVYLLGREEGSTALPGAGGRRGYGRHWTPVHLDWTVADMAAAIERATRAGARVERGSQVFPWGILTQCSDPFGHGFCLIEWRGKGYGEDECA